MVCAADHGNDGSLYFVHAAESVSVIAAAHWAGASAFTNSSWIDTAASLRWIGARLDLIHDRVAPRKIRVANVCRKIDAAGNAVHCTGKDFADAHGGDSIHCSLLRAAFSLPGPAPQPRTKRLGDRASVLHPRVLRSPRS